MKAIVMHFTECKPGLTLASARICRLLAERYNCDILDKYDPSKTDDYDLAILVSSASGFADPELREQIGEIAARARRYVFAQNDYVTTQAGQVNKWFDKMGKPRERMVWSTIPRTLKGPLDSYVNWNQLTWNPVSVPWEQRKSKMLYYGAFRNDRAEAFTRYLSFDGAEEMVVSTTTRAAPKFRALGDRFDIVAPFQDCILGASGFQAALYLEDEYSSRNFCSLANRFYEYLSAGVAIAVDRRACGSFSEAGFRVRPEYVVDDSRSLRLFMSQAEEIATNQRADWFNNYSALLQRQITEAEAKIGIF